MSVTEKMQKNTISQPDQSELAPQAALMKAEFARIEQQRKKWLLGQTQVDCASLPASWQPILQGLTETEQNLYALILSQQQLDMASYQAAVVLPSAAPLLPELLLPVMPLEYRPLFARVLKAFSKNYRDDAPIIRFLAHCGYSAHPLDWFPQKNQKCPELYLPWINWLHASDGTGRKMLSIAELDKKWSKLEFNLKLENLKRLRHQQPQAVITLLQQHLAAESASTRRYQLVSLLSEGLTVADADYLLSLQKDEFKKVQQAATQLLNRLQIYPPQEETLPDLINGYQIEKNDADQRVIMPRKLKSKTQQALRSEALERTNTAEFAAALELSQLELLELWAFDNHNASDNQRFIQRMLLDLPEEHLPLLIDKLASYENPEQWLWDLSPLVRARLSSAACCELFLKLINNIESLISINIWLNLLPYRCDALTSELLLQSPIWAKLSKSIRTNLADNMYLEHHLCLETITALGLLLNTKAAEQILSALIEQGVLAADPALDALKLNIAL